MESQGRRFGGLVDVKDGDGAKTRRLTGYAAGSSRNGNGDATVISIVKKHEREFAGRVGGDKRRAMLGKEPVCIRSIGCSIGIQQREVALVAEVPEDVSRTCAVVVVNLDEPILVTAGDDQVAIIF